MCGESQVDPYSDFPTMWLFRAKAKAQPLSQEDTKTKAQPTSQEKVAEEQLTPDKSNGQTKQVFGHQSSLPDILYPLSFAGPLTPLWVSPSQFFTHPWVLYSIGFIGVMVSAACLPVFEYIIGLWLNGITNLSKTAEQRKQVGTNSAYYMLAPMLAVLFGSYTRFACCQSMLHQFAIC
jgi:hypothetical protein